MFNPCKDLCNKQSTDECSSECKFAQEVQENKRLKEHLRLLKQRINLLEQDVGKAKNIADFSFIFRD